MGNLSKGILFALVALVHIALGVVYLQSGRILSRQYTAEPRQLQISSRPEIIAEGRRLANIYGCGGACHGESFQGRVLVEGPLVGRIIAPGLTDVVERYTLAEIEATVRQGVKPDGTSIFVMPSAHFATMTDADLAAIISFFRSLDTPPHTLGAGRYGLALRLQIFRGGLAPEARKRDLSPWPPGVENNALRFGEYLVRNACLSCHDEARRALRKPLPELDEAKRYGRREFRQLLQPVAGPMTGESTLEFGHGANLLALQEDEITAVYSYLLSRP